MQRDIVICHPSGLPIAASPYHGLTRCGLERRIRLVLLIGAESFCSGELTRACTVPFWCITDTDPPRLSGNPANASGAGVDGSVAYFVMATSTNWRIPEFSPARGSELARRRLATPGYRAMAGDSVEDVDRHRERTGTGGHPLPHPLSVGRCSRSARTPSRDQE